MIPNDIVHIIDRVINYIEDNIKEINTFEDLCHINVFKYHFLRTFKLITGYSLMDYIKKRRLAHSIDELIYTDLKIIDIAYEYNFKYKQTYERLFKKNFKVSPNKVRKEKLILEITDKFDIDNNINILESMITLPAHQSCSSCLSYYPSGSHHL